MVCGAERCIRCAKRACSEGRLYEVDAGTLRAARRASLRSPDSARAPLAAHPRPQARGSREVAGPARKRLRETGRARAASLLPVARQRRGGGLMHKEHFALRRYPFESVLHATSCSRAPPSSRRGRGSGICWSCAASACSPARPAAERQTCAGNPRKSCIPECFASAKAASRERAGSPCGPGRDWSQVLLPAFSLAEGRATESGRHPNQNLRRCLRTTFAATVVAKTTGSLMPGDKEKEISGRAACRSMDTVVLDERDAGRGMRG